MADVAAVAYRYLQTTTCSLCCVCSCCQPGETIRQTAERTAQQLLLKTATRKGQRDDVAQLHFVGNCPAGWFWRTANEEQGGQHEKFGDKVTGVPAL